MMYQIMMWKTGKVAQERMVVTNLTPTTTTQPANGENWQEDIPQLTAHLHWSVTVDHSERGTKSMWGLLVSSNSQNCLMSFYTFCIYKCGTLSERQKQRHHAKKQDMTPTRNKIHVLHYSLHTERHVEYKHILKSNRRCQSCLVSRLSPPCWVMLMSDQSILSPKQWFSALLLPGYSAKGYANIWCQFPSTCVSSQKVTM